jgi:septal ring factor EnvC (AmiA/AmiB activator)
VIRSLCIILAVFLSANNLYAASIESKIKSLNEKAKTVETQRSSEEKNLHAINLKINSMQKDINRLKSDIETRKKRIDEASNMIGFYEQELRRCDDEYRRKVVDLYEGLSAAMNDSLSSSASLAPYAVVSIKQSISETKNYNKLKSLQEKARKLYEYENEALKKDVSNLGSRMAELDSEKQKKTVLLAKLKKESASYKNEIDRLMKKLRAGKKKEVIVPGTGMGKYKGSLPWPVKGRIVRGYGNYRDAGVLQVSKGIDISADIGAKVKCVYSGKIVYSGWLEVLGNTLIVDHGNGFHTVYGYLEKSLKGTGQEVSANEYIAVTGRLVNPPGANLHFEIRYLGKAIDPSGWFLKK